MYFIYTYVYFISLFCFDVLRLQILSIWHLSFILYMYIRTLKWSSQQNKQLVGGFATSSRLAIFNHNFRRLISRGTVKNIFPGVFILVLVHSGTQNTTYTSLFFLNLPCFHPYSPFLQWCTHVYGRCIQSTARVPAGNVTQLTRKKKAVLNDLNFLFSIIVYYLSLRVIWGISNIILSVLFFTLYVLLSLEMRKSHYGRILSSLIIFFQLPILKLH